MLGKAGQQDRNSIQLQESKRLVILFPRPIYTRLITPIQKVTLFVKKGLIVSTLVLFEIIRILFKP